VPPLLSPTFQSPAALAAAAAAAAQQAQARRSSTGTVPELSDMVSFASHFGEFQNALVLERVRMAMNGDARLADPKRSLVPSSNQVPYRMLQPVPSSASGIGAQATPVSPWVSRQFDRSSGNRSGNGREVRPRGRGSVRNDTCQYCGKVRKQLGVNIRAQATCCKSE